MFAPPFCPHRRCSQHVDPEPVFYVRHGSYQPKCRSHPVPRFRCRSCRRTFSRQTFRVDYRDHAAHLNPHLFELLASGVGLRQSSRILGLSRRCTELKARKIGRHARRLNCSLGDALEGAVSLHFDEFETYEGQRNTRPLSVPLLIESTSRYIVWAESAPIRPRGKMTEQRSRAIAAAEEKHGPRKDLSRRSIERTLKRGAGLVARATSVRLHTDEKAVYPGLAAAAFGARRLAHLCTSSKLARTVFNPLFPINHEEALMRDLMGRMRRESWLVSKARRYLDIALHVHIAYRNLVRRRFNDDEESPAVLLGFLPRRLTPREVLSWRQEWGGRSIHPLARHGESVRGWRSVRAA